MTQTNPILALEVPNPNITIRPVRFADVEALHTNCWPERDPDTIYRFIGRIRHSHKDGRGLGAVVMDRTRYAVGYGQFVLWPRCGEISDLIITPELRSQGLGTALIQYLAQAAQTMHAGCIEIGAALSNPGAVNLYRRMGFRDSYTQVVNLNGRDEEVLYLRIKFPR